MCGSSLLRWLGLVLFGSAALAAANDDGDSWQSTLESRKAWWSFQPIQETNPPVDPANDWSEHPIDRFVFAGLAEHGLAPNESADRRMLVRRLSFALTGLPPTPEQVHAFVEDGSPEAYDRLVDNLLESPHFGERWARHWMDWIRYAESHGSEGDPAIDNAWHYRDYLIRALNADVPYDQLAREHVAGDLLDEPRINEELGINESIIGTAHWRMVFHGFAPTDALDEKVRFVDDQINAFSKAFLGLTVSCARCHDHKFDAISQADYYALFGILASCRPGRNVVDLPKVRDRHRTKLVELKPMIRNALADDWRRAASEIASRLLGNDELWAKAEKPDHVLHVWRELKNTVEGGMDFGAAWQSAVQRWWQDGDGRGQVKEHIVKRWDLTKAADYREWFRHGNGLPEKPSAAGEFSVAPEGDAAVLGIYPAGVYSHLLSTKHAARLTSPDIALADEYEVRLHVVGQGGATTRYVVQDYPRDGTVFPVRRLEDQWQHHNYNLDYWQGDTIHLELTTGKDAPLLVKGDERSWFGVREVVVVKKGATQPPQEEAPHMAPLLKAAASSPPNSFDQLAALHAEIIAQAIEAFRTGTASDAEAKLLHRCVTQDLLPNQLDLLPTAAPLVRQYRELESAAPVPMRVPGLEESVGRDHTLYVRGNHKTPGEPVPRRFLEAIDPTPYSTQLSGRKQLADDLLRDDNPFTSRVVVNRIWHHLFGRGLVATPDNFGQLGSQPSHPELLDYLATRFVERGWSIKDMIRTMVTSRTWQMSSLPSAEARARDPENTWLSHANLRRLEAEAIRDALLFVSGTLDATPFGRPVDGDSNRRSVYVRVVRNDLDPFLRTFDFPEPFATVGRRDVTNVPAQSLTLMNDDRIGEYARQWAAGILADESLSTDTERLERMFVVAFSRLPREDELDAFAAFLHDIRTHNMANAQRAAALREDIANKERTVEAILQPVRDAVLAARGEEGRPASVSPAGLVAHWDFEDGLQDSIGQVHGKAQGNARLENGALIVDGDDSFVLTAPLPFSLRQKTLVACVQLDDLDQRGGGVISVQSPDGAVFDAIVFAEQASREWLAGSDFFSRTQPFGGIQETQAAEDPVHIAVVYENDGHITAYRNGEQYGEAYKSNGPVRFKAGEAIVSFGIRHLPANGMLAGRILEASVYDRALGTDEIAAIARADGNYVSDANLLASQPAQVRFRVHELRREIGALQSRLDAVGPVAETTDNDAWTEAARALINFKEFIYVK